MFYVTQHFTIKNIIIGKQYSEYQNLMEFVELQRKRRINLIVLEAGNCLSLNSKTKLEVLFPDINNKINENGINNNSLVFKIYYKDTSFLFTGDIEEEAEKVLVNLYKEKLKSDILKVAHHGSKTSSTEEFIEMVKPKIALIGVGKNNNFGHPSYEVVERIKAIGSNVYRTDNNGEITIKINKKIHIKSQINDTINEYKGGRLWKMIK